jgi:homoserine O-succinyltransferase/O-acetyltransferase
MPVLLERRLANDRAHPGLERRRQARFNDSDVECIDIGLINNMPDTALASTERQFIDLLAAASGRMLVRLKRYSLPDVPRSNAARDYIRGACFDIGLLWGSRLDGIIVTGTEPRAPSLSDEPYWTSLTKIADWAEERSVSSVWSCLAAHAAVLHLDGIRRQPLADKRFGLFECTRVADHPLMKGTLSSLRIAHSRWNELPEGALTVCGYTILTRSIEAGIDSFVKERNALALFFQGHPEYDARALLREYRRDICRFLKGERETYPAMPQGYFDEHAMAELATFRLRAIADRREDLIADFPSAAAEAGLTLDRDSQAARIYGNWLSHLSAKKAQRTGVTMLTMSWPALRTAAAPPAEGVH